MKRLFREGDPYKIKSLGDDQYHMSVTLPTGADGRIARECPNPGCSPAYFKVTPGTGITDGQVQAYCPYCRHEAEPSDFTTHEQIRYAKDIAIREAQGGIDDMIKDGLGLGPSGKKKIGAGLISMEMSYKPSVPKPVRRPYEDEVRRDVVCPHCALDQTVFGLAAWCSDCGRDIFLTHVSAEIAVTRSMLSDVDRREQELGRRVAAKDLENCLEDTVSIFEASAKALVRRALGKRGDDPGNVDAQMKKIGNSFQSSVRAREQLLKLFGYSSARTEIWDKMGQSFEKRQPVTHNLGACPRIENRLRKSPFGPFSRSFSLNMNHYSILRFVNGTSLCHYSPQIMKKSTSNPHSLATTPVLGQAPRRSCWMPLSMGSFPLPSLDVIN